MKINQKTFKNFLSQYIFYSSYPHPQISFHVLELILVFLAMRTILFFFCIVDTITVVPISPPLPASAQPSPLLPSGCHHTAVCVYVLCTCVL